MRSLILFVHMPAQLAQCLVRLRQVLAIRAFALEQVGHRIQPQAVHSQVEPEIHGREHGLANFRVVPIQIRLVGIEAMPVIRFRHRVPRPVRGFEILEDDARVADISPACRSTRRSCASEMPGAARRER